MDIFSIEGVTYRLTKENYIKATNKIEPYYQEKGSHFAICPCCGNPVQIINLFIENYEERVTGSKKLHARHYPRSVLGVAEYNEEKYNFCELHNPVAFNLRRLRNNNERDQELKELIEKSKNKIICDIREIVGIYFKKEKIEKVINSFIESKNYCYTHVNKFNIPYVILYTQNSIDIFGQKLNLNTEIGRIINTSIERRSNFFEINEDRIIRRKGITAFVKIFLMIHNHRVNNNKQYVDLKIFEKYDNNENTILEQRIEMKEFIYDEEI